MASNGQWGGSNSIKALCGGAKEARPRTAGLSDVQMRAVRTSINHDPLFDLHWRELAQMTPIRLCPDLYCEAMHCRMSTLCFWCHSTGYMTVDHIISKPLWKFGKERFQLDRRSYKVASCRQCNEQRAAISLAFQHLLKCERSAMPFFKTRAKALPYVPYFRERYERLPPPLREACIYEVERLLG